MITNLYLHRDITDRDFTLGELTNDGKHFSFTCEDTDRKLEAGGEKLYGQTAIPRGRYKLTISYSPHFQRNVVEILDVPDFTKVYFHGGNTAADSLGCILHGRDRTANGVAHCAERVQALVDLVEANEDNGDETWCTIS